MEGYFGTARGFVGRGSDRRVDFPFGVISKHCKSCDICMDFCPMSVTPCDGYMESGKERLCGNCESMLPPIEEFTAICEYCHVGEGFQCINNINRIDYFTSPDYTLCKF
jgi:Fe-S-cluster-containing hydrogenase component 2